VNSYDKTANVAQDMLRRKGQELPISRARSVSDPVTGATTPTTLNGTIFAVVLPGNTTGIQAILGSGDNKVSKDDTVDRVRYVIGAAKGAPFTPDIGDVLTFDGNDWRIFASTPISPAGVEIIHKMGVRRA
jgi:hypothetical protein